MKQCGFRLPSYGIRLPLSPQAVGQSPVYGESEPAERMKLDPRIEFVIGQLVCSEFYRKAAVD
jgi:hypothetical protein